MRHPIAFLAALAMLAGCPPKDDVDPTDTDTTDVTDPPEAFADLLTEDPEGLLSIGGTGPNDIWAVGGDGGHGPTVLHYDGTAWERLATGTSGDLWWVNAIGNGEVILGGEGATILRGSTNGTFTRVTTPGDARHNVFGVWADSATNVWAVGAYAGRSGFIWHDDGGGFAQKLLPLDIPRRADGELPPLLKVWSDGAGAVWVVGGVGTVLRSVDGGEFEVIPTPTTATLFTIAGAGDHLSAVGGDGTTGVILDWNGTEWVDVTPAGIGLLQGLDIDSNGDGVATGAGGVIAIRRNGAWSIDPTSAPLGIETLHAAFIDSSGGTWAVGGDVLSATLKRGTLLHRGGDVAEVPAADPYVVVDPTECPANAIDPLPTGSIARRWNEQTLNAIRRDIPRPGVHARNLFHSSLAAWDAWAAYDEAAIGVISDLSADGDAAALDETISYAMYRVLMHRYVGVGAPTSQACFNAFMDKLGYDPANTATDDSPAGLGNRIGQAVIDHYADDGANEANNYADTTGWTATNTPIGVDNPHIDVTDPDMWTQLNLAVAVTQNGIPVAAGDQQYIGANWGDVETWAMNRDDHGTPYLQAVDEPKFADPMMNDWLVEVIRKTAWLASADDTTIDISPKSYGNNPLGTNDGTGYATNPKTGQPYAAEIVKRSDFGRVMAEFWADGPKSETPPGHWFKLANEASDHPDFSRKLFGLGAELSPLAWDVHAYLALGGAVHDAAIAAWDQKRHYTAARPISLIRYKASLGQSSDARLPSYDADGLPIIPGMIEVITEESSAPGERHQFLRHFVGEIAIWTWPGEPGDRKNEIGHHQWVRGVEWIPYQRRNFVTPAFPGFISGHSTFSRSAAETLTQLTGDAFVPGGLGEFVAPAGNYLVFEDGPVNEIRIQWATWYDAADQAGQSRLWGGIHIWPDDEGGRRTGAQVGDLAVDKALTYYGLAR